MPRFRLVQDRSFAFNAAQDKKSGFAAAAIFPREAKGPTEHLEKGALVFLRAGSPIFLGGREHEPH